MDERPYQASDANSSRISPGMASLAVVVLAIVLSWGTLRPKPPDATDFVLFPHADKLLHFFGWFVLGVAAGSIARTRQWQITAWVACSVFGLMTEIGQLFVVGRYFEFADLAADTLGALFGSLVVGEEDST